MMKRYLHGPQKQTANTESQIENQTIEFQPLQNLPPDRDLRCCCPTSFFVASILVECFSRSHVAKSLIWSRRGTSHWKGLGEWRVRNKNISWIRYQVEWKPSMWLSWKYLGCIWLHIWQEQGVDLPETRNTEKKRTTNVLDKNKLNHFNDQIDPHPSNFPSLLLHSCCVHGWSKHCCH